MTDRNTSRTFVFLGVAGDNDGMDNDKVTWEAPEFVYHQKSVTWYWVSILITVLCLAFAVYSQNFLFAVFVVLAEILLVVWSREMPKMVEFSVTKDGVRIGEKDLYHFEELVGFSILDSMHGSELILKRKNKFGQYIKIPITDECLPPVEAWLREKLPKKDYEESLSDSLFRIIKF